MRRVAVVVGLAGIALTTAGGQETIVRDRLASALARLDAEAIREAVAEQNRQLGDKAGVPEVPDRYLPIPKDGMWYAPDDAKPGFEPWFRRLESLRWWKIGLDPTRLDHALREPAAILSGNLAACRARLNGAERSLEFAQEAADFLIWAQEQGGTGVFPFPAARGITRDNAFVAADKYLKRAEKAGRLEEVVKNGWVVKDDGDGGLQFDNGECGVALLELFEFTQDPKYLVAARKAADWALSRPLVPNWNYNSFSVYLLARAYQVTGEPRYLEGATQKARLGVIPGQLTQGPNAGRWNDPHNARPSYHYIMLRALAQLAAVMPQNHGSRVEVMAALRLGLRARNQELRDRGAANKDKAMEVLLFLNRAFADDKEFLQDTRSAEGLDALAKLVSEQARRGNAPLGPREWGLFLEYVLWKGSR